MKCFTLGILVLCGGGWLSAAAVAADTSPLKLDADMQSLLAFTHQEPSAAALFNPDNLIAALPSQAWSLELRPNLRVRGEYFSLSAKPRIRVAWLDGEGNGETDVDAFLNSWKLSVPVSGTVSLSYGREVLQWGNGTFRSPSNPFFIDTGKLNPITEVYGKDFFTLTYMPSPAWSFMLIDNAGIGSRDDSTVPFERILAAKIDYVGEQTSLGAIVSQRREDPLRLGAYLTRTVSDALLVYAETALAGSSEGFYPERAMNAIGWDLVQSERDSDRRFYSHLLGAAYTLEGGATFTLEFLRNNEGYDAAQARDFEALGRNAQRALAERSPASASAGALLGRGLDPNLGLLRRDYLFLQFSVNEYRDKADVAVRFARNLDDQSSSLSTSIVYSAGQRIQLFLIGSYNTGGSAAEFSRLLDYTAFVGMRYFPF